MSAAEQWQISGGAAERYEQFAVGRHMRPIAQRFVEQLTLVAGQRVLDVACGTGIVARLVASRVAPGRVVGMDLNEGMLEVARRIGDADALPVEWLAGDAMALPFQSCFDVVLCQQGLQFVPDRNAALASMRRALVPGGILGLNVFGSPSLFHAALARGMANAGAAEAARLCLAPFGLSDREELLALLDAAGFADITLHAESIARRVEPTHRWLLDFSSALPYGAAIARLPLPAQAEMLRDISRALKEVWCDDAFIVPCEVLFVFARA